MREVEYRAWKYTDTPEMFYDIQGVNFVVGIVFLGYRVSSSTIRTDKELLENLILMQYTGLKDRNNKKIYEGDILRFSEESEYIPNRDSGGGIIDYDKLEGFTQYGVVSFDAGCFEYKTHKTVKGRHSEYHAPLSFMNGCEIIGNVYEDTELLK